MINNKREKIFSQLRRDLVSGTWVVYSTKRSEKPDFLKKKVEKREVEKI